MNIVLSTSLMLLLTTNLISAGYESQYLYVSNMGEKTAENRFKNIIKKNTDFDLEIEILYVIQIRNQQIITALIDFAKENNYSNALLNALLEIRLFELEEMKHSIKYVRSEKEDLYYTILQQMFACHSKEESKEKKDNIENWINFFSDHLCFDQILDERPFYTFLVREYPITKANDGSLPKEHKEFLTNFLQSSVFLDMRAGRELRYYEDALKQRDLLDRDFYLEKKDQTKVHSSSTLVEQVALRQKVASEQKNIQPPDLQIKTSANTSPPQATSEQSKTITHSPILNSVIKMGTCIQIKNAWMDWQGTDLLKDVFLKYTGSEKIDFNDKCAQAFLHDVEYEEKRLKTYLAYAHIMKKLHLNRAFGMAEQDIALATQKIKKLQNMKNTFIDWFIDLKVKLNINEIRQAGFLLLS